MNKKCIQCGLCREVCPVFKASFDETLSPRGKSILKDKKMLNMDIFYKCTVCKSCEINCPINYDFECEKIRQNIVSRKEETEANREMMRNIRKYGNPFGKLRKGEKPKKLYCC